MNRDASATISINNEEVLAFLDHKIEEAIAHYHMPILVVLDASITQDIQPETAERLTNLAAERHVGIVAVELKEDGPPAPVWEPGLV